MANFTLEASVADRLNGELHKLHRAALIKREGRSSVSQGPRFVLYDRVQTARTALHHELRQWMGSNLPGAFARSKEVHPLFDLLFFEVAKHWSDDDAQSDKNDAPRACGVEVNSPFNIASDQLPGLQLHPPGRTEWAPKIAPNTWTLWGNSSAVPDLAVGTEDASVADAGYFVGEEMTDYFTRTGLTALLDQLRSNASIAYDNARELHGGTSSRDLKRLRDRTLTTSLDLARLEEDIETYNNQHWREREPQFHLDYTPAVKKLDAEAGRSAFERVDLNKSDRDRQKQLAKEIVAFDARYRDVLSTAASLGASLDARRAQRLATGVSLVSLGVALVTLWVTQETPPNLASLAGQIFDSLRWPT
ncbi:hypothetical protein [Frigoribacterium sp. Leaf172]|uniref:hypothetical protein n=1 Tax=Frigoribacterium sp. Leaf172 TaxID=1736285 RepID=UPI0012E7066B|nr:hypothetical protein [Frigoribacterium sp. Leaf172]